jgi:hypothetical protein
MSLAYDDFENNVREWFRRQLGRMVISFGRKSAHRRSANQAVSTPLSLIRLLKLSLPGMILFKRLYGTADYLGPLGFLALLPEFIALHFIDRQYILRVKVESSFDALLLGCRPAGVLHRFRRLLKFRYISIRFPEDAGPGAERSLFRFH